MSDFETRPSSFILKVAIAVGVLAVVVIAAAFPTIVSPPPLTATPLTLPTLKMPSPPADSYQPEIFPLPTFTPRPSPTVTLTPTNTPFPTPTPFILPTIVSRSDLLLLPDLTITGVSDPLCVPDRKGTVIELDMIVRNIGQAGTRYFGAFQVEINFILGEQRYSLDDWAKGFNGLIGASPLEISALDAGQDLKLVVVIDLKGNKSFGVEVTVNSGADPIRETDRSNNTLTKYFSVRCY